MRGWQPRQRLNGSRQWVQRLRRFPLWLRILIPTVMCGCFVYAIYIWIQQGNALGSDPVTNNQFTISVVLGVFSIVVSIFLYFLPLPTSEVSSIGHSNAVLFDEAHGQSLWTLPGMPPTIGEGYRRLKELTQQHYTVEVLQEGRAISADELGNYAAFVLSIGPGGRCHLKSKELDAIRHYVRQGGGLLVLGYYTGDWHHEANLNKVLENYGITFNNDVVMPKDATADRASKQLFEGRPNSEDLVVAQPAADDSHTDRTRRELRGDLLTGVNKIATLSSCSLRIELGAAAILSSESESTLFKPEPQGIGVRIKEYRKTGGGPAVLVGASVNHKVIAVGSWKTFLNEFIDDPNYDNRRLYENALRWLTAK